jgi:uncharacterized protein YoxC
MYDRNLETEIDMLREDLDLLFEKVNQLKEDIGALTKATREAYRIADNAMSYHRVYK